MSDMAIDSPSLDAVDEVAAPEEVTESTDTPEEGKVEETAQVEEVKGDERTMPKWVRDLKSLNPEAYREAKNMFFSRRDMEGRLKDFPLDNVKSYLEERGGLESLQSMVTELQSSSEELQGINAAISAGDVSVIDKFVQASGDNFPKLASATFQKWGQSDPEGWGREMSGVFAATIAQAGLGPMLDRMQLRLQYGDTQNLGAELNQLKEWADGFGKAATAAPQNVQGKPNAVDSSKQELETLRKQVFDKEVGAEMRSVRGGAIKTALSSFLSRRPGDTDIESLAMGEVDRKVQEAMNKDADLQNKLQALYDRKDKVGFLRLANAREAKLIETIAPQVGKTIFRDIAPTKAAPVVIKDVKKPIEMKSSKNKFDDIWASA